MTLTNASIDKLIKFHSAKLKFYREMKRLNNFHPVPKGYGSRTRRSLSRRRYY